MALPKLNDQPKYDIVVPSSQTKVRYRPYLVKEEKVLMLAMESKDSKKALGAIVDTIGACVQDDLDTSSLTTFDVEYLFTQIRSKSVGETSEINLQCAECEKDIPISIPLSDITVTMPKEKLNVMKLTDDIQLKMRYPAYNEILEMDQEAEGPNESFKIVSKCIESVQTNEENISLKDESEEEIQSFIDSLTTEQFGKIREFLESIPKLEHKLTVECPHCNHTEERILAGINNFF